jgi:hypothetical protein
MTSIAAVQEEGASESRLIRVVGGLEPHGCAIDLVVDVLVLADGVVDRDG